MASDQAQHNAYRVIGFQFLFAVILVLCWSFVSLFFATSAMLGALVCILPNLYFAYRFFARARGKTPRQIVKTFYASELVKLCMSGILIAFVLAQVKVALLAFFTGFFGAHMGFWLAPLIAGTGTRVST